MAKLFSGVLVCVVAVLIASSSFAAEGEKKAPKKEGKRPTAEAVFKKLDADGNGKVTAEEMAKGRQAGGDVEKAKKAIERMDTDKSGDVCAKEFAAAWAKRAEGAKKGDGERKGPKKEAKKPADN